MQKHIYWCVALLVSSVLPYTIRAQQDDPMCNNVDQPITQGDVFLNYGSAVDAFSIRNRSSFSLGQPSVGNSVSPSNVLQSGYWARFLVPPLPPIVTATQGDLLDRIQVSWDVNPLGAQATDGYKLYRDGVFLALVDKNTRNYNDFNVIAGRAYNYEVSAINFYGEGSTGKAVGFQTPNGVVTGWIQTSSGRPVPDAFVALTPLQGFSARFGPNDGAFAQADIGTAGNLLPASPGEWSITFWVKTDSAGANAGILSLHPFPLIVRPFASNSGHEGVDIVQTANGTAFLSAQFPDSTKNDWHQIALTVDEANQGRLYLNGVLVAIGPMPPVTSAEEVRLGERTLAPGNWAGCLDELRIYHRRLDEFDLGEVMMGTASSQTPDLAYYWKMDEERGTGSFDVLRRNKLYFCGATFKLDRPYVRTMGKTNQDGYYRIESASYGTGTTFLAEPMKDFYRYRSLKFVRGEQDFATLPDFSLTPKATLEMWVNTAGPDGTQCLLSKRWSGNDFRLLIKANGLDNELWFYLNGQEHKFGNLGVGYCHLAFTIDSVSTDQVVTAYKDGVSMGSHTFSGITGNWSDTTEVWMVGARPSGMVQTDFYGGLIDEIALYDTTLSLASIQDHVQNARDMQAAGLRVYFSFDEGNGNRLNNSGSVLLPFGTNNGAEWSSFTARQLTTPHIFTPATRQVTLNPSVTSVDQVDFIDRSTIPVSGFVRYKNTDCFAPNVEILVNGASYSPAIFTDSTGKFIIDFDPGASAILTPVFEDHVFIPASWEVSNVVNPIAGILFNDVTTRKVTGIVAGGSKEGCNKSIIDTLAFCVIKVASTDGCLERFIQLDRNTQTGEYEFLELPPLLSMTVAVVEHSNPNIKSFFQVEGGSTVNLSQNDTVINFIYVAPPEVLIASGLDTLPGCSPATIVLNQTEPVQLDINLIERYVPIYTTGNVLVDDGICTLDTADFSILNGFADEVKDTSMSGGLLRYRFVVGDPNPSPPFIKTLQIIGTSVAGRSGSLVKEAIITGIRSKENTFTSMMPEMPTIILRDPPGDGSSAYLEKDQKICKTTVIKSENEIGFENTLKVLTGPKITLVLAPLGVGIIEEIEPKVRLNTDASLTYKRVSDNSFETCVSFSTKISTDDNQLIVGGERGGDVFVGEALNLIFGFADKVSYDTCTVTVEQVLNIEPDTFATTFVYSEFHIRNNLLRYLGNLAANPDADSSDVARYLESIDRWNNILERNKMLKDSAAFIRNISFDAGAVYEYKEKSDTTDANSIENYVNSEFSIGKGYGFTIKKVGFEGEIKLINKTSNTVDAGGGSTENGLEIGYTLKDDDPGDAFTVDVAKDSVYLTPVFRLKAGQSSCPWEPGTANREGPNLALAPGTPFKAINVPAHEPAVFQLNLGNLSATNEDWTYGFTAVASNNPDGAIIRLNGQFLNNNTIKYIVPYNTSTPITLTIERGPTAYEYDNLLVGLVSECEMERNFALSLPLLGNPNDPTFFSPLYLGVDFIRPCSEVDINVPEQNWVVLNNDPLQPGTLRRITASGYDLSSPDFQLVRVQYRRSDGDGAWINLPTSDGIFERYNPNWSGFGSLPPGTPVLGPAFSQFVWETAGLGDGDYEIHAWAVCSGDASDKPGFSDIIKGRIDREPPSILGVPEPTDGVYHVGDEISFTFNQEINCDRLIPADQTQLNNVGLYDATTDQLIDISVTCYENKLILDPTFDNKFFENRLIRAELAGIEDLVGNEFNGTRFNKGIWEFYVDRNELAWLTDSLGMTKYEDENKTVTANIHNRGGYPVPFTISGVPDWVRVVPDQGTLAANEILPVSFYVDSSLAFGRWSDSIFMTTETGQNFFFLGGTEGLPVGVRVGCSPPFGP
ncbi:MAG: LamG-like jellyroll fold domain-containing protein, partial [Saprospiraceae bacterium]|nr:LamG-like jellyroll fold domain-containing protein [Saprospiraceae bacterium]